ncbi:MAG: flagellar FlbD family protein [Eubacteriales bacterium]|jgi:flagellar protein FlbD
MIILTKLNGIQFVLNCDMIETISENPDTTIFLTNGNIHIVKESMQEIIEKTIDLRRRIFTTLLHGVSE